MGTLSFCVNFCWAVGIAGVFFLSVLAIQVGRDNDYLLRSAEYKSSLILHLCLAVLVQKLYVFIAYSFAW